MARTVVAYLAALCLLAVAGCATSTDIVSNTQERYVFPQAPHIVHLASFGSNRDIRPPSWFRTWIIGEDSDADTPTVTRPYGIAAGRDRVFINDGRARSGYWVLDLANAEMRLVRSDLLTGSTGMALDERGFKYFAVPRLVQAKAQGTMGSEEESGAIVVFDPADNPVAEGPFPGRPIDLAIAGDRIYVTDAINHRVVILDKATLEVRGTFGTIGERDQQFRFPKAIAADQQGRIYVGDTFNGRVKVFDSEGGFIAQYGHRARVVGSFMNLSGLAVDRQQRVYAVDAGARLKLLNEEVQVLDASKFYRKGEAVPPVDSRPDERKQAVFGYFQKPNALSLGGDPQAAMESLYRPINIAIDYRNADRFRKLLPPESNQKIEYLLWLTSESAANGRNVSVFALTANP